MLEISLRQIKNCICELEAVEVVLRDRILEISTIYENFGSNVSGQMDKAILRHIIDDMQEELNNARSLRKALISIVASYKKTENEISHQSFDKPQSGLYRINIQKIRHSLETLGVFFE